MVYDDSDTIWFADETLAVFFTIVARGIQQLDQLHGPGSTDRFLEVLEYSLVGEFDLLARIHRRDAVALAKAGMRGSGKRAAEP